VPHMRRVRASMRTATDEQKLDVRGADGCDVGYRSSPDDQVSMGSSTTAPWHHPGQQLDGPGVRMTQHLEEISREERQKMAACLTEMATAGSPRDRDDL